MLPISKIEDLIVLFATPVVTFGLTWLWAVS